MIFHSIVGQDEREQSSPSWFNIMEAKLVLHYIEVRAIRIGSDRAALSAEPKHCCTVYQLGGLKLLNQPAA